MLTSQKEIYILKQLREIADKIRLLELEINNLEYHIADDDEWAKNDTQ